jgi:predicted nucleic acid-binding Zn ribbon protein
MFEGIKTNRKATRKENAVIFGVTATVVLVVWVALILAI